MKKRKHRSRFWGIILTLGVLTGLILKLPDIERTIFYPVKYQALVEKYAARNNLDKYYVYAVIKTESGFDPDAVSDAGAMGLMQIMEDSFEWVKYRMGDESDVSYDDILDPEINIKYGTYLLRLLYEEYGSMEISSAAYHTGRGNVNKWLGDSRYGDGKNLYDMPSAATKHYVNKVTSAYKSYKNLYN